MEAEMLHRVIRLSCTTAIFLAINHPGIAANDNDSPGARAGALLIGARVDCMQGAVPQERFDPPSTSALRGPKRFVAAAYFKEDISTTAEVRIAWLGANFMRRYVPKTEDEAADVELQ